MDTPGKDGVTVPSFDGLGVHMGNLSRLSSAVTRSVSAENPTGGKGAGGRAVEGTGAERARDLGVGWKVSPSVRLPAGEVTVLAEIEGPGAIQHIWMTCRDTAWRSLVIRCYWDGEDSPSIEVPLGDFFCNGWSTYCQVSSVPVAVNPRGGFNSYWEMPFRRRALVTIENLAEEDVPRFFYQFDYALTEIPDDRAYLHCQWRRSNPVAYRQPHTILDGVRGRGQYVGTYLAWGSNSNGWWGEGEVKFYLDGDDEFPTICGTGVEDYFGGAWGFVYPAGEKYAPFTTPYLGMPQALDTAGFRRSQPRFGMYRWHVPDPIRFTSDLRVTVQALGWRNNRRYMPLRDDIASTAWWYQAEPHEPFPSLPDFEIIEVV
jgi:D-arabinan exo alpha-(1,3)/(1,5)-arabinofuranosidase (non-reducing end)